MIKDEKITKPFFSHDYSPLEDKNLLRLDIAMGNEGYGLYWKVVEYMHQNSFGVGEEDILAYKFRTDVSKIKQVMNDFGLFRLEDGCYISDRILRNLNYVEQKKEDKREAVNIRWLLSAFNKAYIEFFGEEPILTPAEIESLKRYSKKIPDLKSRLRDILYTLKNLKFDTDTSFKPCANWLLKDNNLARLINGEFGKLKHLKTKGELKEEQRRKAEREAEESTPTELEARCACCSDKSGALNLIAEYYSDKKLIMQYGKALIIPIFRPLMQKYNITDKEVFNYVSINKNNE